MQECRSKTAMWAGRVAGPRPAAIETLLFTPDSKDTSVTSSTTVAPPVRPTSVKRKAADRKDGWLRRLPLLPALVVTLALTQFPFLLTLIYSTLNWNLLLPGTTRFTAFDNYIKAFRDPAFLGAVGNTLIMTVSAVLVSALLGLGLALLLDRKFMGRGFARTLAITPFLVMPAAGALVWKTLILNPSFGVLNWALAPFGSNTTDWIGQHPMFTVVMIIIWQWTPFMMLILLAGLQSQSPEILEAARVDGANGLKIFRYLTFPHLRQYLELAIILGSIYIIQTFDQVFLVTQGGPGTATTNLPYFLYLKTFRAGDIGYASAVGVLVVIGTVIIATLALRVASSLFKEEGSNA
jgi:sorbitol/mannitol transport system permease protein